METKEKVKAFTVHKRLKLNKVQIGLQCWRDVAYKVLSNTGWETTCAYEDTIYPKKTGQKSIKWEAMTFPEQGESPNPSEEEGNVGLDIHIKRMDWSWSLL